jgi:hypothetical protein
MGCTCLATSSRICRACTQQGTGGELGRRVTAPKAAAAGDLQQQAGGRQAEPGLLCAQRAGKFKGKRTGTLNHPALNHPTAVGFFLQLRNLLDLAMV